MSHQPYFTLICLKENGAKKAFPFKKRQNEALSHSSWCCFLLASPSEIRKCLLTVPCQTVIKCNSRCDRDTSIWKSIVSKLAFLMTGPAIWKTAQVIRRWLREESACPVSLWHIVSYVSVFCIIPFTAHPRLM